MPKFRPSFFIAVLIFERPCQLMQIPDNHCGENREGDIDPAENFQHQLRFLLREINLFHGTSYGYKPMTPFESKASSVGAG
jgi:hypothetical protein